VEGYVLFVLIVEKEREREKESDVKLFAPKVLSCSPPSSSPSSVVVEVVEVVDVPPFVETRKKNEEEKEREKANEKEKKEKEKNTQNFPTLVSGTFISLTAVNPSHYYGEEGEEEEGEEKGWEGGEGGRSNDIIMEEEGR
jgi:hypothetical protein